jgi:DNA-binding MarR family transcriptional regulator
MTEDKEKLFDDVGIELGELRRTADRLDEAVATQFGLNRTDLRCIGILYRRGRVTAGELAEESGLTPGAITTVLDRMERDGYANRVADPSDRRRVLVTSTTATRELGARVYGEVELAGRAQLEQIDPAAVAVIRDYLRGIREFYEELVRGIASPQPSPDVASAAAPQNGRFTAPLDGVSLGRLEFIKGAAKARIGVDASLTGLYHGEFKGSVPDITVEGGTVTIGHRRHLLPFDWRVAKSTIALNPAVPWEISMKGGMWKLVCDLRGLELRSLEVGGGASDVEIWLPVAAGVVPVRISGGASDVRLHRPAGCALAAEVTGGASQLVFDGEHLASMGRRSRIESANYATSQDRFEVRMSGGASQLTIDIREAARRS